MANKRYIIQHLKELPKEKIPIEVIVKAIIKLSSKEKRCITQAQGKEFTSFIRYKLSVNCSIMSY